MVKKFFSLFTAIALLFTSCEMLTGEQTGKFHITSETTITVPASGACTRASYVIDEAVDGAKVTAVASVDWIKDLSVDNENCTINFCIKENGGEARTGAINAAYAGATATITINQEAAAASRIELLSNDTVEVAAGGNCLVVSYAITEVIEGLIVEAESADEWVYDVAVDQVDSRVTFCVKPNEGEARTTTVTITYGDDSVVVTVNQEAAIAE